MRHTTRLRVLTPIAILMLAAAPAGAVTVRNVAINGVDDPGGCGALGRPCRTIQRAVLDAAAGDRIVVGPGLYGAFTLDKEVMVESTNGAGATIIEGSLPGFFATVAVSGTGEGAVIGRLNKGFTIRGADHGFLIEAAGVTIQDNIVSGAQRSVTATAAAPDLTLAGNFLAGTASVFGANSSIVQNAIHGGATGVVIGRPGGLLRDNFVLSTQIGATVNAGPAEIRRNTFAGSGVGLDVKIDGVADGVIVMSNNFLGNGTCGVTNRTATELVATSNYWGSATGPGSPPATATCARVRTTPFLRAPVSVNATGGR